jgi:hypothetical protein
MGESGFKFKNSLMSSTMVETRFAELTSKKKDSEF